MPKKNRCTKSYPALVFIVFFAASALVSYAAPIESARETSASHDRSRLGVEILGGAGLLNGYSGISLAFGATFSYGFSKNIAIELAGLVISGNGDYDPQTLSAGRLTIMPLQLSLLGRFPLGRKLTPYVLTGGSFFFTMFALDKAVAKGWEDVGITLTEKVDNAFGFHFGAGLEYALGKAMSVAFDVRYILGKTGGAWSIQDNASASETDGTFSGLKLNTLVCSVGLKYLFR